MSSEKKPKGLFEEFKELPPLKQSRTMPPVKPPKKPKENKTDQ